MTRDNWGIRGNEWAVEMLRQQIVQDSIRHAYLFCGPPGVGRRTLALRFIQALNCPNPPAPGEACGTCRTCQQIERMEYASLEVVEMLAEKTELTVSQVRAVRRSLSYTPYQGKYRTVLF